MTLLECFSGGGGAALGLHRAGMHALAHLEWDADACATLRAAVEAGRLDGEVVQADISTADLSPWAGVDALWSSFPCQCWSLAGKRLGAKDERNGWPWTVRAIDQVKPRWVMCENVPGLTMHRGDCVGGDSDSCAGCYFHGVILPDLRARFAHVQWAELNAADFGTPQHRRRIYIVAGPRPVPWPEPTHAHPSECYGLFSRLRPWVSVRQALSVHNEIGYRRGRDGEAKMERHSPDDPACALRGSPGGSSQPFVVVGGGSNPRKPGDKRTERDISDEPSTTIAGPSGNAWPEVVVALHSGVGHTPTTERGIPRSTEEPAPTLGGKTAMYAATRAASEPWPDDPSPTLTGGSDRSHVNGRSMVANADGRCELFGDRRQITLREALILMGWPEDWPLQGTQTAGYRQAGNGCAPQVVEALARAVLAVDGGL